jgi:hypothetical protein
VILLFLGNIDLAGILVFSIPIAIPVYFIAKKIFKKRFSTTDEKNKVVLLSILSTVILSPLILILMLATAVILFIAFEKFQFIRQ